jgi:uncharacterized protein (DUF2249 family)
MNRETKLDTRSVTPAKRRPPIFDWFNRFLRGEAFILVNHHYPKALYYQFQAERPRTFAWEYVEANPETRRVRISRI